MNKESEQKKTPYQELKELIEGPSMVKAFREALHGIPVQPWIKSAITALRRDNKLASCSQASVIGVLMEAACMGLRLEGPLGQAYLSSREIWTKNGDDWQLSHLEAQLQVGYRGFIDIAYRDNSVREVEAVLVYKNDHFEFSKGSEPFIKHNWDVTSSQKERGSIVAVYSGLRFKDGFYSFEVYPYADVKDQRDKTLEEKGILVRYTEEGEELFFKRSNKRTRYEKIPGYTEDEHGNRNYFLSQTNGKGKVFAMSDSDKAYQPWLQHPIPMVKKTAIRWSSKYWPLSNEFQNAAYLAEMEENGLPQQLDKLMNEFIPEQIRAQVQANLPNAGSKILSQSQNLSMAKAQNLAAQMAAEAGIVVSDKKQEDEEEIDPEERRDIEELEKIKKEHDKRKKQLELDEKEATSNKK